MGRIQRPCNICGRGNRKGEEGRIRPTTGSKRATTKLTRYADKSRTELNNASSRRQDKFQWRDVDRRPLKD